MGTPEKEKPEGRVGVVEVEDSRDKDLQAENLSQIVLLTKGSDLKDVTVAGKRLTNREIIQVLENGIQLMEQAIIESHLDEYPS